MELSPELKQYCEDQAKILVACILLRATQTSDYILALAKQTAAKGVDESQIVPVQ